MYDAIIVGARCGGSPLAMLLARQGHHVLVVDRDTFPSDTLSTAFLRAGAVRRLHEWGLFDRFLATNPAAPTQQHVYWSGNLLPTPPIEQPLYTPRRTIFDKLLVDAAREAGAEVREGFSVRELLRDSTGAVTGIAGRDANGNDAREEARIVIGADGRNSFVAKQVDAEQYDVDEGNSFGYYSFYSGLPLDRVELHFNQRHVLFHFPTHNNQACIAIEAPRELFQDARKDPKAWVEDAFRRLAPSIGQHLDSATHDGQYFGVSGRTSFFRKPYGPGWALIGDAGLLKDPVLGTGIDDAFRDADFVAEALHAAFSGASDMETALASYHARRDAASKHAYDVISEFGRMDEVGIELIMKIGTIDQPVPA